MSVQLIYDPGYLTHNTGNHPENRRRLEAILRTLDMDEALSKKIGQLKPKPASNEDITRCHREELVRGIENMAKQGVEYIDVDTRISPESFEVARLAAGAAIAAV